MNTIVVLHAVKMKEKCDDKVKVNPEYNLQFVWARPGIYIYIFERKVVNRRLAVLLLLLRRT